MSDKLDIDAIVLYQGHRAIVQEILPRGIGILRQAGPSKGVPIFVQPEQLTVVESAKRSTKKADDKVTIQPANPEQQLLLIDF